MKKILLLGSGELGKEFVISLKRLGCYVVACDSYAGAPAMQVADESCVFNMLDEAPLREAIEKHKPDLIVPEIEAIRTEVLLEVEKEGFEVIPSARATNLVIASETLLQILAFAQRSIAMQNLPRIYSPEQKRLAFRWLSNQ
jgi:phosphoribosylglycinamide formyltransferase 2